MRDGQHRENPPTCPVSHSKAPPATNERLGARGIAQGAPLNCRNKRPPSPQTVLGHQKDFLSVRILDFGSWRKSAHVNVTRIRSVRACDKAGFIRNGNPVGNVALGRFNHSGGSRRLRGRFLDSGFGRRRAGVLIVGLRRRRILRWSSGRVFGWAMTRRANRRLIFAGGKKSKGTEKKKRKRKFHK
jgi:hypothetical protein